MNCILEEGNYEVVNYVLGSHGTMDSVPVGRFNCSFACFLTFLDSAIEWPGNTTEVPLDFVPVEPCPPGQFGSFPDCKPCEPGLFSATAGMNKCTLCSDGGIERYQPNRGMSACEDCPPNTKLLLNSRQVNRTDCICRHGFWRPWDAQRGKTNVQRTFCPKLLVFATIAVWSAH